MHGIKANKSLFFGFYIHVWYLLYSKWSILFVSLWNVFVLGGSYNWIERAQLIAFKGIFSDELFFNNIDDQASMGSYSMFMQQQISLRWCFFLLNLNFMVKTSIHVMYLVGTTFIYRWPYNTITRQHCAAIIFHSGSSFVIVCLPTYKFTHKLIL